MVEVSAANEAGNYLLLEGASLELTVPKELLWSHTRVFDDLAE